ncbi:receptor-like protein 12 [Gossypium australe]|uniref:Receptor-like protein 12 n=1 Tax=Gossypium australe TaxID=47621 RepID=A0A5B6WHL8_9ROSI|nr:receptor-like protein 12 [Gossypium australe]
MVALQFHLRGNVLIRVQLLNRDLVMEKGFLDKVESIVINPGDDNENPTYPSGFTSLNIQSQPEIYPQRVHVTIRPQQYQVGTLGSVNYPMGLSSKPGDNPTNPIVPNLDDMAEIEKAKVELPRQLEDRCRWLEEKFRAI